MIGEIPIHFSIYTSCRIHHVCIVGRPKGSQTHQKTTITFGKPVGTPILFELSALLGNGVCEKYNIFFFTRQKLFLDVINNIQFPAPGINYCFLVFLFFQSH